MREFHPVVTTIYYVAVIGVTMFSNSPIILAISLVAGIIYALKIAEEEKGRMLRSILTVFFVITILSTLINGLFTHNGKTVLFYIGPNRITLEAFVYGFFMSMMVTAVIVWFISFGLIMTSDKLITVFGHLAPVLGLTISMIFRFVPLLRDRYGEISMGQAAMGRGAGDIKGLLNKLRQKIKEISILISWSLEASIETADSMTARGYGLPGRSAYRIFKAGRRDYVISGVIVLITCAIIALVFQGAGRAYYYPELNIGVVSDKAIWNTIYPLFLLLAALPTCFDCYEDMLWKRSE